MPTRITRKSHSTDARSPIGKRRRISETEPTETEMLCAKCRGIQAKVADGSIRTNPPTRITNIDDDHEALLTSACPFCRLLGSIKDPSLNGRANDLYAFSANAIYARINNAKLEKHNIRSSILVRFTTGSVTRSNAREARDFIGVVDQEDERQRLAIGPRCISNKSIDYSMIKDWILFCQKRHKRFCNTCTSDVVKNMHVLDVDSKNRIVKPENCEYVALSYVWGTQTAASDQFSRVVEDSFVVTKKLGYKYLWVDRHCIDQDDFTNKHDQIKAMHLIYGSAVLTLIAAAGDDSEYGLPGVGSRERVEQNVLSTGNKLYIRTFPHASRTLDASKWATRGWTFQEGLLSKRRLILTDHQVSFQCNGMHCSQAVHWPYDLMHARTSDRFPENVPNAPFGGMTLDKKYYNERRPYINLMENIINYSHRSLSFPSDILNAFLGILSNFASRKDPIYHVWAIPVVLSYEVWSLKLNWMHAQPCRRRPGFPSWSWAGWTGPILGVEPVYLGGRNHFATCLEKDSRGDQAEVVKLQDFAKQHVIFNAYATSSPFLRVTIMAFDLEFTHVSWSGPSESAIQGHYKNQYAGRHPCDNPAKEGLYAKLSWGGYTELSYFWIDDMDFNTSSLEGKTLPAMLYDDNPLTGNITFIVLVHRGEDRFERLGCVRFSPTTMGPTASVVFRLDSGELSKTRPDIPGCVDKPELFVAEDRRRTMNIRLG